jgi:hypothetical protein
MRSQWNNASLHLMIKKVGLHKKKNDSVRLSDHRGLRGDDFLFWDFS